MLWEEAARFPGFDLLSRVPWRGGGGVPVDTGNPGSWEACARLTSKAHLPLSHNNCTKKKIQGCTPRQDRSDFGRSRG